MPIHVRRQLAAGHQLTQGHVVAVECSHDSGSMMVRGYWGAMRAGEGTKSWKME
jgi:hypothetical protein